MAITWNTGLAAERARHNRRLKNRELNSFKRRPRPEAPSYKPQAPSLTRDLRYCRMILERNIMNEGMENLKQIEELEERSMNPLIRIANAMEEILRLVKEDQENMRKISEKNKT